MKNCFLILFLLFIPLCGLLAQTQPRLVLPVGHTGAVLSTIYSPDGKRIATASADNTAKIWDSKSGVLLHTLEGHADWVRIANYSPDGKRIVTASRDGTAKIWDSESGTLIHTLEGHSWYVSTVTYSPDGKRILTASGDKTAKIWDSNSGVLLYNLESHTDWFFSVAYCPDGKRIVTASDDNTTKIWDSESGALLQTLEGHTNGVRLATYSPDGKRIVTASRDGTVRIWDSESGALFHTLRGHSEWVFSVAYSPDGKRIITASKDNTAKIWDSESGRLLHNIEGHNDEVFSANYSPDGKRIVTASRDNTAKIWDSESIVLLHTLKGHTDLVYTVAFSPDGKRIVTASSDNTARIWDLEIGALLHTLELQTFWVNIATFSPDRKRIVTASADNTAKIWDSKSGVLLHTLKGHAKMVIMATYSPDGKRIITASKDNTAKIWDSKSGVLLHTLEGHADWVRIANFSPDGKRIVTASEDSTAKIWDSETGALLHTLEGHTRSVCSAAYSPDGKRIVTASADNTAKIWDSESSALLHTLEDHGWYVLTAAFSQGGTRIATTSADNTAKIWDSESGKLLHTLENHADWVIAAFFSSDGKRIVTTSRDNKASIWDSETGALLNTLEGHTWYVLTAYSSPDGKKIYTASEDCTLKIWDSETGKLIKNIQLNGICYAVDFENNTLISHSNSMLTLWDMETEKEIYSWVAIDSIDYLVIDPYGRYDGTPGARDLLYFVCGLEVIDLAQMKDALYVPGLVERIMNNQDINYPKLEDLEICGTLPLIEKEDTETGYYIYRIAPRKLGLEKVEVYVNNKLVYTIPANELKQENDYFILQIEEGEITKHFISGADNSVNVVGVVSQAGRELRSRGVSIFMQTKDVSLENPSLYAVMIGVNDYRDQNLRLNYPVKDAQNLGSVIEQSAHKLLGEENVHMYYVHSDLSDENLFTTPEREGIRRTLEDIGKKAKPEDVILIFFAGHGVMQGTEEKLFTFLTAEASTHNNIGVSTKDLQSWLSYNGPHKILANKTILIFDACHSGQATEDFIALARNDDDSRRIRQVEDLKDKSGMFILAASAPNQVAYELPQLEQGMLTYSMLHTLKNNPEILDDGRFLNVQKWFLESEKYLAQLVASMGFKQDAQPFGTANIRIGEVDEEIRIGIVLAEEKPIVMCANVLNSETFNDDLQLKEIINNKLSSISERGTGSSLLFSRHETPGVNKINIIYSVQGDNITCQVNLIKGSESLHKVLIAGKIVNLDELVKLVINEVVEYAK